MRKGVVNVVQNKLPLINSAHGSETRNIINELIKLFNGMGYTYNEALQKAHDVLDEAQRKSNNVLTEAERVNAMNESVQQQINTLIADSGTSDAELLQSRIDADGNAYPVLKERLDAKDQSMPVYAAYYGVSHTNSAADNTNNLKTALSIAENESRPLILPMTPAGEYIEINDVISSYVDGVHISGYGVNTRVKQTVFPKGGFHLEGDYNYIGNFEIYGIPFDGKGMGHTHSDYSGITNYGSYSTTEKIKGDNFSVLIRGFSRTKQIVDSQYINIKSGKDVAFNLWHGNSKDCYFDKITGSYSDKTDAPPHLIYIDHANGLTYNLRGGSSHAYNGEGSFAFQFKGCVGGEVNKMHSDNCEGNLHLSASEDFKIGEVISIDDTWNGLQGQGAMTIDEDTKNIVIDTYEGNFVNESKALQLDQTTSNIKIKNLETTTVIEKDGVRATEPIVDVTGSDCIIHNPKITGLGQYEKYTAIYIRIGKNNEVINPIIKGFKSLINTSSDSENTVIRNLNLESNREGYSVYPFFLGGSVKIITSNNQLKDNVIAYDDVLTTGLNNHIQTNYTSSGVRWLQSFDSDQILIDRDKMEHYSTRAFSSGSHYYIDTNNNNISIEADVVASDKGQEGLIVRLIDRNNFIGARIDNVNNQAIVFKNIDGTYTTLDSSPFNSQEGRKYKQKIIAYGNQIDFYVDDNKVASTILNTTDYNTFSQSGNHGMRFKSESTSTRSGGISDIIWKSVG